MNATQLLFREDPYLANSTATVVEITAEGHVILDKTIFYPMGGGQPGDQGQLNTSIGDSLKIVDTQWLDPDKRFVVHQLDHEASATPSLRAGDTVQLCLNWELRYRRMRVHTALHLLSVVLPYPVTGGSIGEGEGRLDFDIPNSALDKNEITQQLQALVNQDASIRVRWFTDSELEANPDLVKTLSVQPPKGSGQIRLIDIEGLDLQPCGGTHLKSTSEIGDIWVRKIEKKGKQNRRVRVQLAD